VVAWQVLGLLLYSGAYKFVDIAMMSGLIIMSVTYPLLYQTSSFNMRNCLPVADKMSIGKGHCR
jgi:hypothetical protein